MKSEEMQALIERSKAVLSKALQGPQAVALAGLLVPLGALGVNSAEALTSEIEAAPYSSRVDSVLEDIGGGVTRYNFTVVNTSNPYFIDDFGYFVTPIIVDWELPSFTDPTAIIFNVQSPNGWDYEIIEGINSSTDFYNNPNGPFGQYIWEYDPNFDPQVAAEGGNNPYPLPFEAYNNPPFLIHWFFNGFGQDVSEGIFPGDSLGGFSFETLATSSDNSPYASSWDFLPIRLGDPPVPGNNEPGIAVPSSFVPEPTSMMLLAGLGGLALLRRRA